MYSKRQAKSLAEQIWKRFGYSVRLASLSTKKNKISNPLVSESLLAAFIGIEAGKDSKGLFKINAKRFEKGVYQDLISLRDRGFCFIGGKKRTTYSGVKRSQIQNASDGAIRNLSVSWTLCQIMGWHCINNLNCSLSDLRTPEKMLGFAAKLLLIVSEGYIKKGEYESVFRIWNTGRANGKTYHADYVINALAVKAAYNDILSENRPMPSFDELTPVTAFVPKSGDVLGSFEKMDIEPDNGFGDVMPVSEDDSGLDSDSFFGSMIENAKNELMDTIQEKVQSSIDSAMEAGKEVLTDSVEKIVPKITFPAFIPRLSWKKILGLFSIPGLSGLGSVASYFSSGSSLLVFVLGCISGIGFLKAYDYIKSHHVGVLSYITQMNQMLGDPDKGNPVLTQDMDSISREPEALLELIKTQIKNQLERSKEVFRVSVK